MKKAAYHSRWRPGRRPLRAAVFVTLVALWALASCSRDAETPVGSDLAGDLLGSAPGSTFVDTISVFADTVINTYSLIAKKNRLQFGIADDYERLVILRPNFTAIIGDTVALDTTFVRIRMAAGPARRGRILYLGTRYSEGDRITTLDTVQVLPDPKTGEEVRDFNLVDTEYYIPSYEVENWIREDRNNGIVIAFTGTPSEVATFYSREATGSGEAPYFSIRTEGATEPTRYGIGADATFVRPLTTTSQLIASDGFTRRVWWRADIQSLGDAVAINRAAVRFYTDTTTVLGSPIQFSMYIPDSPYPVSPVFLDGVDVSTAFVDTVGNFIEFPMTLTVQNLLTGNLADNGFVFQYLSENQSVRQMGFYTSNAPVDSLRPRLIVTATTPVEFKR